MPEDADHGGEDDTDKSHEEELSEASEVAARHRAEAAMAPNMPAVTTNVAVTDSPV